jgi:GH24 family phage-related lysozyme (muramidase)
MAVPSSAIKKIKTKTRDNTQTAILVLIRYGVFSSYDIDKAIAAVNSKDTWIAPSNLPDYTDRIENDIAIGRETPEIVAIRKIIAKHYDIDLEEEDEIVEEKQEVIPDASEKEKNNDETKKNPPGALVVATPPKKEVGGDDLIEEEIDERILRILGLEDVFDIDYETYISLLREKMISGRMVESELSSEENELLTDEFKRVKGKVGRFKPKKKQKINVENLTGIGLLKSTDKKSSTEKTEEKKESSIFEGILNVVKVIGKTVDNIYSAMLSTNSLLDNQLELDRRETENIKRGEKEKRLETKKDGIFKKAKKILAPVESIFDRILKFLLFTILGRAIKLFMDWASDEENMKKLKNIGRFLKDWWPALLTAWIAFTNPLGKFIRFIIGTILKLSWKLAKFAIPKILSFVAKNPKAAAAAGLFTAGLTIPALFPQTVDEQEKKIQSASGTKEEKIENLRNQKQNLSFFEKLQGKGSEIDEQINFLETGETKAYTFNNGGLIGLKRGGLLSEPFNDFVDNEEGNVFSGEVDRDTGKTVSGAGPDTQFFPIAEGGGAVLQRGEVVLQKGARERMIQKTGIDPLSFNIGSNANVPRKINTDTLGSFNGGLIGLSNGGEVGTAIHHLKQDEALSSLRPGVNDMVKPGTEKWSRSNINSNTPIHSYLDSVKKPTIGWGSTFYDSILSGKRPVKMGDKITKSQADGIFTQNVSNLSKEYSTKIPHWNKMSNNQRAGLLVLGYNAPYGPLGAYPSLTKALRDGDMQSASKHLQRGGPNAERIALERKLLLSGPLQLRNLVGPKIVGEKKVGSGVPGVPPIIYNIQQKMQKKQGGGVIKMQGGGVVKLQGGGMVGPSWMPWNWGKVVDEHRNTKPVDYENQQGLGANLARRREMMKQHGYEGGGVVKENSGVKNPHSTADRRALPIFGGGIAAVNPGEVVLSNRTVFEMGGPDVVNRLNLLDKNSEISKRGGYNKLNLSPIARKTNIPPPSSSKNGTASITLPPIKSSSGNTSRKTKTTGSTVPPFSTVSPVAMSVRVNNADIYGIVG